MPKALTREVYPDSVISTGGDFVEGGHRGVDHSRFRALQRGFSDRFTPWAEGGVVRIRRDDVGIYGQYIEIVDGEGIYWSYCHADRINPALDVGDPVTFETWLGTMGSTGSVVDAGSEHLHTMCARKPDSAIDQGVPTFDPVAHIKDRLPNPLFTIVASSEGDPDMFQYSKQSGTRWFVHPSLPVRRISAEEWAANEALGIRTERRVDNGKAEIFRRKQNARAKQLDITMVDISDDEAAVEVVLGRFDLPIDIANSVSDVVYSRVEASADPLSDALLEQIANDAVIEAGGEVEQ